MSEKELVLYHNHSFKNRKEIEESNECGCFYCQRIFHSNEVEEYIDEGQTAICPYCGIDSVIGNASGVHLTALFLLCMNKRWI